MALPCRLWRRAFLRAFEGLKKLKPSPLGVPEDAALIEQAGLHADRLSINVELPTDAGLTRLAPDKDARQIEGAMGKLKGDIVEAKDARLEGEEDA